MQKVVKMTEDEKFELECMLATLMWKEGIFSKEFIKWVELEEEYSGSFLKLGFPEKKLNVGLTTDER
jgi:hypothetical protein